MRGGEGCESFLGKGRLFQKMERDTSDKDADEKKEDNNTYSIFHAISL